MAEQAGDVDMTGHEGAYLTESWLSRAASCHALHYCTLLHSSAAPPKLDVKHESGDIISSRRKYPSLSSKCLLAGNTPQQVLATGALLELPLPALAPPSAGPLPLAQCMLLGMLRVSTLFTQARLSAGRQRTAAGDRNTAGAAAAGASVPLGEPDAHGAPHGQPRRACAFFGAGHARVGERRRVGGREAQEQLL